MKRAKVVLLAVAMLLCIAPAAYGMAPENLLGLSLDYDKKELTIHVAGSGCTAKEDFLFELKNDVLTIFRKFPDSCKAMQSETRFTYSLKEVGIDPNKPFKIANKFIANRFIAPFSR